MNAVGIGLLMSKVFAGEIDVYGVDSDLSAKIIKKYGVKLASLEENRLRSFFKHQKTTQMQAQISKCIRDIQHEFFLPSIKVDTVYYPDSNQFFTTIDCCVFNKDDKAIFENYPSHHQMDIVDRMHFFIKKAGSFVVSHPQYANHLNCRDFQCITPELPEFDTDLNYFRKMVPQSKLLIENTIFHDLNLERRRSAIFLLAYYQDPNEISKILVKLLSDKSYFIRHDALRVYGELYAKSLNLSVPIQKVLPSIHACDVAERNKALILVNEMAKHPQYHEAIKREVWQLIRLLQLKQPNNHLFAYDILKKISHKNYDASDLKSWQFWAKGLESKV
jgi:hypothetical protein